MTLSTLQPEAGTPVRAVLTDPDGSISGLTWRWSRSGNTQIPNATSSAYTPVDEDAYANDPLMVTATYKDGEGAHPYLPSVDFGQRSVQTKGHH